MPITGRAAGIKDLDSAVEAGARYRNLPKVWRGVKMIACIEDPVVIDRMLAHLDKKVALHEPVLLSQTRAPPQANLFG